MYYICNEIITIYNKIRYKKNQIENKMRILELFKKNYKKSSRPEIYEEIAQLVNSTPQHVYNLAHGKRPKEVKDDKIITHLIMKGVIH